MRKFYSFLGALLIGATSLFAQTNYTVTFSANVEMEKVQVKNLSSGETKTIYSPDNVITLQKNAKQEQQGGTGTPIESVEQFDFLKQTAGNEVVVNMEKAGRLNLTLYSSNGTFVARYSNNVDAGQTSFQIGASSGVYALVASANNQQASLKIILTQSKQPSILEVITSKPEPMLKSIDDVITFDEGDEFEFTGYYSNQTDVKTAVITVNKTITFSFTTTWILFPVPKSVIKSSFSISPNNKVYFSQGNLQCHASAKTWKFADNQYDIIGEANENISSTFNGWFDLFGWGTSGWNSGANAYQPYSTSWSDSNYYPGGDYNNNLTGNYANADWGVYNKISNGGNATGLWRTLTYEEWRYLLRERTNASSKIGSASVNGQRGVIILPDDWILPDGLTFSSGFSSASNPDVINLYDVSKWEKMEKNGAIFLPYAGIRGNSVVAVGSEGYYWSSSACTEDHAYCMKIKLLNGVVGASGERRALGCSVRLVCDAPMVTTWQATNITYFSAVVSGSVLKDNEAAIKERGICWSTTKNPTITDNKITCETERGELFSIKLTDLSENTTYFARAYATNAEGTLYGDEITFTTKEKVTIEGGAIQGTFSVSETKIVYFSKGNLQYQASTKTWKFADNQYDIMGKANKNISSSYSGWIDLFGWGTSGWYSGAKAYQPYSTNSSNSEYYPGREYRNSLTGNYANADWGVYNKISNGGNAMGLWRTLTYEEWKYLLRERTNASIKYGFATVNDVPGLILLPDSWILPEGMTFSIFTQNTYSTADWTKMEANGAVFLPAAGGRNGTGVNFVGSYGDYWSSSAYDDNNAYCLSFGSDRVSTGNGSRYRGLSVRLVRDL